MTCLGNLEGDHRPGTGFHHRGCEDDIGGGW